MNYMTSRFFVVVSIVAAASPLGAVVMPVVEYAYDKPTSNLTLSWHGETAHTYFIQQSLDLMVWNTVPIIESGANAPLAWSLQIAVERTFFRVLASDLPTGGNPETADFDGDGLNNLAEVNLGSNPISLDSDRDGMLDSWEHQHGFNLTQPDGTGNADGDSLSNLAESQAGTDPNIIDAAAASSVFDLFITAP